MDPVNTDHIDQARASQRAISQAFDGACEELDLGLGSLDVWKRERLAQLILQLVEEGEADSDVLQKSAVSRFRHDVSEGLRPVGMDGSGAKHGSALRGSRVDRG